MARLRKPCLVGITALTAVCALQLPLVQDQPQQHTPFVADKPTTRSLVDSQALQDSIKGENLLARAKELYKIAKLGEAEYNHPTRVIGSQGRQFPASWRQRRLYVLIAH